jgi:Fe-S cluster assembly protein SufD
MKTKAEQAISESFEAVAGKLPGSAAVKALRSSAIGAFSALGLPHRRIEEWKYTDLRASLKEALPPAIDDETSLTIAELIVALGPLAHLDAARVAFVNGRRRAELDDLGEVSGLNVTALGNALTSAPDDATSRFTNTAADAVAALNTAFMTDGALVQVADRAVLSRPLLLVFVRAGGERRSVALRNVIAIGPGASATIIEAHVVSPGAATDAQVNAYSAVSVGKAAKLNHVKVAVDGGKCVHLANWDAALHGEATYRGFQFSSGLGLARNEIAIHFAGEGGKLDLSGAYLARGAEHIDTTLIVDHAVPRCASLELFKGVLDGQARGIFQGKIIVRPNAQKTDGKQMSQALLLSADTEFDSKPELEIFADDVACGHGSTAAELDPDLLFYCRSRGIPEGEARALMIESFVGEALEKVEHIELRAALMLYAASWLASSDSV